MSYAKDVYVESTSSAYNPELHVILSNGKYQLCTRKAIYSYEDKYINFRGCFEWIKWEEQNISKVLLLGLGLGSVPQMLEQNFRQNFEYHAVELDDKIIALAEKYILYQLQSPIQIFHTDAMHYVNLCQDKYDMIVMDVFDSDKVPLKFEDPDFLEALAKLLTPEGFVLFNRLNITEEDRTETLQYYNKVFLPKFPKASCSPIEGNFMLISHKAVFALQNS